MDPYQIFLSLQDFGGWFFDTTLFRFVRGFLAVYTVVLILDIILLLSLRGVGDDFQKLYQGANDRPKKPRFLLRMEWNALLKRLKKGSPSEYQVAIIKADQFTDRVLGEMNYLGANLQERLEHMEAQGLTGVDLAKEAHQICNRIVLEPGFVLTREEAERVLGLYATFLTHWEVI
jgi:hypothetical protein